MTYTCPYAERIPGKILLRCKRKNGDCGNQRYCSQRQETVLTAFAKDCPLRKVETHSPDIVPAPVQAPKKKETAKKKKAEPKEAPEEE